MEKTQCFPFLIMSLAVLAGSYGLGEILLRLARPAPLERWFRLFLALTLGLTVLVGGYAILTTGGRSILLPLLALVLLLVFRCLRVVSPGPDGRPDAEPMAGGPLAGRPWGPLLLVFVVAVGLFGVRWALLYDPASPFLLTPFQDYIYYSRLSLPLNQGLETHSLEQFYPQFTHAQPYHYFEPWLSALLVRLSGLPAVWCLYLAAYTVLTTVVFVGLRALLAFFGGQGAWAAALAAGLLLVSGVYWPAFEHHPFAEGGRYVATSLLLLEPKLSPIYIFLLLSTLLVLRRRWRAAGLALAALPLVFVTTIPAVLGCLGVFAIALGRRRRKGQLPGLLLPTLLVLVYMGAFYALQPAAYQFAASPWASPLAKLPRLSQAGTLVNIFAGTLINVALYAGAYVLVLLLAGWGRFRAAWRRWPFGLAVLLGGLLTATLAGAAAYTITTHLPDSYQLLGNVFPPVLVLFLGGVLAALLSAAPGWRRAAVLAALLALAWVNHQRLFSRSHSMHEVTRFAPGFLRQVRAALAHTGGRGGFLMADADYETIYHLSQDTFTRGTYVANFLNDYALVSLSALDVDSLTTDPRFAADTAAATECIRSSSFVRFVKLNALRGRRWPKDSAQYQFVVQQGLRFICLAPTVPLPATLGPLVQARYRDPLSGEEFVLLRPHRAKGRSVTP